MVVCYHYMSSRYAWGRPGVEVFPTAAHVAGYGWLGVYLFFLVSGFVICLSCWGRGLRDFFVSRVTRLYPAFWFAVAVTAAVRYLWPDAREPDHFSDVFTNLTMFQEGMGVGNLDGVYWTLWVELRFYLIFAVFVVLWGVTYRRVVFFCVGWTALSAMAVGLDQKAVTYVVMPQYSSFFVAGIAMFLMYRYRPTMLLWGIVGVSWIMGQHQLIGLHRRAERFTGLDMSWWPALLLVTAFFAIVAAAACGRLARIQWRWLATAGVLTYPLYLIHEVTGWEIIRALRDDCDPALLVGCLIVLMLCLSWLVHILVEKPVARWLKNGLTKAMQDMPRAASRPFAEGLARMSGGGSTDPTSPRTDADTAPKARVPVRAPRTVADSGDRRPPTPVPAPEPDGRRRTLEVPARGADLPRGETESH